MVRTMLLGYDFITQILELEKLILKIQKCVKQDCMAAWQEKHYYVVIYGVLYSADNISQAIM